MRYLDSTSRTAPDALGHWLKQEVASEQAHLRIKTGYFTLNGLAGLKASLDHLVQSNLPITIALGANEKATIKADVDSLYTLIGCPRPNAKLCVVSCVGGLFHPKVVHLTRTDGSALAYVGSANATPAGFNGTNIESGLLLDTRLGDPKVILDEIAASIDEWFKGTKVGVTNINGHATTQHLVTAGILGVVKPVTTNSSGGSSGGGQASPKMPLAPLVTFPSLAATSQISSNSGAAGSSNATTATTASQAVGLHSILIAEIGKGVRWKQANFPKSMMQSYFGVNPIGHGFVNLIPVSANGTASPPVVTQVVSVQSQNYRLELSAVAGLAYPTNGRPIAVFRRTAAGQFRYHVFFPGDLGYAPLSSALAQRYQGAAHHLKRITVDSPTLASIWPACPV